MNVTKLKRQRYQQGSLTKEKRRNGPMVWVYRWREQIGSGKAVHRKKIVGTVQEHRSEAAARKAVDVLTLDINAVSGGGPMVPIRVSDLAEHYIETELSSGTRTALTASVYSHHINKVILPKWGDFFLSDVRAIQVERWLAELPHANSTKAKTRNVFSALYQHARRYEWASTNPISLVRQSMKRQSEPDTLTPDELASIVRRLAEPARTLVIAAAVTGLRRGELFGLKWADVDVKEGRINIVRSLVNQIEGQPKTATSRRPIPLAPALAEVFEAWKVLSPYTNPEDWVFASPQAFGKMPYWPDMLLKRHIRPAALVAGISKKIGWHTFRRTTATLLLASGATIRVTQELMRHASPTVTLGTYAQAMSSDRLAAQSVLAATVGLSKKETQAAGQPPAV